MKLKTHLLTKIQKSLINIDIFLEYFLFIILKERAKSLQNISKIYRGAIDKNFAKTLFDSNPLIIEVGAHHGFDTLEFATLFPESKIYAFESFPGNFLHLQKNCQHFKNITTVCSALSNTNGVTFFYQSSGSSDGSGSLLTPTIHIKNHPTVFFEDKDKSTVITITLDTYFNSIEISKVDLIWIDVQGAEKLVLQGGTELLKKTRYIYLEVSEVPLYEGALAYCDMKLFMNNLGFEVWHEFLPAEWNGEGNVLFRNALF
jgi:FkbM family methyltransferase